MRIRGYIIATLCSWLLTLHVYSKDYAVFDVVGDSISAGVNPECGVYGWCNMLFGGSFGIYPAKTNTIFTLWPGITNWNSAVSGSTAYNWATDWGGRLTAVKNRHPGLVVVFIGGNDLLAYLGDGTFSTTEQNMYRTNLNSIITNLQNNIPVPDIIAVNYYDLFDGFSTNLPTPYEAYRGMSQAAVAGNRIVKEVAGSNRCYMVDGTYDNFMHHCYGAELGDPGHLSPDYVDTPLTDFDIHPITAGHSRVYELIYAKMEYLKTYAVPEWWMDLYGLTNYCQDVAADKDLDGAGTWEEYFAGTCPTNKDSVFSITGGSGYAPGGFVLRWDVVTNRSYSVGWSTNLHDGFQVLETNCTGSAYTDTLHQAEDRVFYEMRVRSDR